MIDFSKAEFLLSANATRQLPPDEGHEIAFVGRSNAGKSSALNALVNRRALAKVSKTPGKTQLINVFTVGEQLRLIDLPGYGFAKVSKEKQNHWRELIGGYLADRNSITGLILLADCRHPLKPGDMDMLIWSLEYQIPVHLLLTKSDKLSKQAQLLALRAMQKSLQAYACEGLTLQLFSSVSKQGLVELRAILNSWLIAPD